MDLGLGHWKGKVAVLQSMLGVAGAKRAAGAAEVGSSPKMSSKAMATDTKLERRLPPCTVVLLMRVVHVTYTQRSYVSRDYRHTGQHQECWLTSCKLGKDYNRYI